MRSNWIAMLLACTYALAPGFLVETTSERHVREAYDQQVISLRPGARFTLAPVIPHIKYDKRNEDAMISNMDHTAARQWTKKFIRPMYYPLSPTENVAFRNPEAGADGGFVRASRTEQSSDQP